MIHKQLKSKKSVGVHWGTFLSPHEHYLLARKDLEMLKKKNDLRDDEFVTLNHGENFTIDY